MKKHNVDIIREYLKSGMNILFIGHNKTKYKDAQDLIGITDNELGRMSSEEFNKKYVDFIKTCSHEAYCNIKYLDQDKRKMSDLVEMIDKYSPNVVVFDDINVLESTMVSNDTTQRQANILSDLSEIARKCCVGIITNVSK
ncbi:MAG: hypothetical protein MJZ34_07515 [Paludibacteraceae bacterium]|nr:hypothetical protein [Paludibacteraceae bacterium]